MMPTYEEGLRQIRALLREEDEAGARSLTEETIAECEAAGLERLATLFRGVLSCVAGDFDEAISDISTALEDPELSASGDAWHILGVAHTEKGEHDRVIECYQKALDSPGYNTPGGAWNNMGVAHASKGEHDRAIECYQKALDSPGYDTPGDAWFNMGVAHAEKGQHDRAIECYQKALDTPGYDTPYAAWHNMGLAHFRAREYQLAMRVLGKAASFDHDRRAADLFFRGVSARKCRQYKRAREWLQQAAEAKPVLAPYVQIHDALTVARQSQARRRRVLPLPEEVVSSIRQALWVLEERGNDINRHIAMAVGRTVEAGDLESAEAYAELLTTELPPVQERKAELASRWEEVQPFTARWAEQDDSGLDDVFVFLKGWSSSIPWLVAAEISLKRRAGEGPGARGDPPTLTPRELSRFRQEMAPGGGYFMKWAGRGTVIDPGMSYVTNFLAEGFHAKEINHVVTTHHHVDHTADLLAVQNIVLEYNDAMQKTGGEASPLQHAWDGVSYQAGSSLRLHTIGEPNAPGDRYAHLGEVARDGEAFDNAGYVLRRCNSQHCHVDGHPGGFALRFDLLGSDGGYVAGIGLSSDADPAAVDEITALFDGCRVIILHFSKTNERELILEHRLERHLGYVGCREIMANTSADLYVIAEFSGERGDYRFEIAQLLAEETGNEGKVIPADVGLTLALPGRTHGDFGIRCSQCLQFCRFPEVRAVRPSHDFGRVRYCCAACLL